MGFIPNSTKTLTAYLTQKGREYIVNGDKSGFDIVYFGLSDSDVNYLVASNPTANSAYNMLEAGQIPDISGDHVGAIHSLAGGNKQRYFLFGGSTPTYLGSNKTLGTDRAGLRFQVNTLTVPLRLAADTSTSTTFNVPVELFGFTATGFEKAKIYVMPPSQGTSPEIYNGLSVNVNNSGGITTWSAGDVAVKSLPVSLTATRSPGTYNYTVKVKVVPHQSAISLDDLRSVITVNIVITVGVSQTFTIKDPGIGDGTDGNGNQVGTESAPIFLPIKSQN